MQGQGYFGRVMEPRPRFRNLTEEQIELIMESRLADLNNIRTVTLYSIAPLILLSFIGGYSIASIGLKPLEDLNKEMKNKSTENLSQEIEFVDNGDEISELIKSFNRMSRRLNKSFEAQKEFVENASHELKTPLAIIQANLDTALEDGNISKKELIELLKSSKESVKFMDKLTEDLLLLSVLEHEIEREEINLIPVVEASVEDLSGRLKEKKIKINVDTGAIKSRVIGNSILLQRAIMNILENAIKYSESKEIFLSLEEKENYIYISIKDNGKGIPNSDLEKIFDRFYRVEKSRSRKSGGSGLGLAITKSIIERFGGEITVESSVNKGSIFSLKLPGI
jgi:signal transduction histidine kinase